MRVVVVGASGNLGTALVRRLARASDVEIDGVSRRVPSTNGPYAEVRRWTSIDVGADGTAEALIDAFTGADAVVNFAWGFQPTRRPELLERTGVGGTAHVVAAVRAAGVPHLIHTSSVGAYQPRRNLSPVDESFPTTGVPGSVYSGHKAAAERLLDDYEQAGDGGLTISRIRPGFVLQRDAGSALFRYGLPGWLPGAALRFIPVLPLDAGFVIPVIAADDVADAVARLLAAPAAGAFNLAADKPVNRDDIAAVLGARPVNLSSAVLEAVVQASWRANLQPLDAGWIKLAYAVPLMSSAHAQAELGWAATQDPVAALRTAVEGMQGGAGLSSPVLRPRTVRDGLTHLVKNGPISRRAQP